jgi:hypothetical protein
MTTSIQRMCAAILMVAVFLFHHNVVEAHEIGLFIDKSEWEDEIGQYDTIDFTDYPHGTIISDQYADIGVNFEGQNNVILEIPSFINDGFGLRGWMGTWVHFDEPMNWIAGDHPGRLYFALYVEGELIGEAGWGHVGAGNFTGVVSTKAFDSAFLFRPPNPDGTFAVYIDDLHFGALTVPAPGVLSVIAFALFANRRRRRC